MHKQIAPKGPDVNIVVVDDPMLHALYRPRLNVEKNGAYLLWAVRRAFVPGMPQQFMGWERDEYFCIA
jgi:uncharacterized protein (DUF3820 family)